jgi:hypothetical protein
VAKCEDDADALKTRINHMVVKDGLYRLLVGSLGDGGGGEFRLAAQEVKLSQLTLGGRGQGTIQPNRFDYWWFAGQEGKTVLVSVRSPTCRPKANLRSPDGVEVAGDDKGAVGIGSLLAVRLPKTGRYTLSVSSQHGAGDYSVRLIDGD